MPKNILKPRNYSITKKQWLGIYNDYKKIDARKLSRKLTNNVIENFQELIDSKDIRYNCGKVILYYKCDFIEYYIIDFSVYSINEKIHANVKELLEKSKTIIYEENIIEDKYVDYLKQNKKIALCKQYPHEKYQYKIVVTFGTNQNNTLYARNNFLNECTDFISIMDDSDSFKLSRQAYKQ